MKILEQSCIGKNIDQSLNEDALIVTENYVAVIDGATSSCDEWGVQGGLIAKKLLSDFILKADSKENGFGFISDLNMALYEYQRSKPELFEKPEKRLMASVLVFSVSNLQLWSYGDCHYLINKKYYRFNKLVDTMNADIRSFVNNYYLLQGLTEKELLHCDKGADEIKRYLDIQPKFANTDNAFGYPILDGGIISPCFFVSHQLKKGDIVVMATDGYPFLESSLNKSEIRLSALRKEDPLLIREFKAVKGFYNDLMSFDDRTYIKFNV